MKSRLLLLTLLLAIVSAPGTGIVSAKQTKVIVLASKDPGSKSITIRASAKSLLLEFGENADGALFTDDAFITINNKDKTYRVQSYSDLLASARLEASRLAQTGEDTGTQGVEFKLTELTETISGLSARKLIRTEKGEPSTEFWVSRELLPPSVRSLSDTIQTILPKNYLRRMRGNPGIVEMVMLYGVPLKMKHGTDIYQAQVTESRETSFQIPVEYKRIDK
jgi:hypothetical protein